MAKTAAERAQDIVDRLDARIEKVSERRDNAVQKVVAKYDAELEILEGEREHALNHPALQQDALVGQ